MMMDSREVIPIHPIAGEKIESMTNEIQTLRAKVEVLEEYKNAVIDHFIVAFHGYDESKSVYDNLSLLIAYYQELALDPKVSKEASDLHAKVASAEVLVEALREIESLSPSHSDDGWIKEVQLHDGESCGQFVNEFDNEVLIAKIATKALATYDKLSEVKHDTK